MKENIVLVGHGSPRQEANRLEQIAQMVHGMLHPGCREDCVQVAYLQFANPEIKTVIDECVSRGAEKVTLHPFFLSAGQHVTEDIPELIEEARRRHPAVSFIYTEPLGIHEKLAQIAMERIRAAEGLAPTAIEEHSFEILSAETDFGNIPPERIPIVKRVIHATADFEFKDTLTFHPAALEVGIAAIRAGKDILTDVEMVRSGINKGLLSHWGGNVVCGLHEGVVEDRHSDERPNTRAARGIEWALKEHPDIGIIAIGNAPSALLKTIELLKDNSHVSHHGWHDILVIGVPVGFVKAAESKALLAVQSFPFITALGRKGGTPVAVAIVNALLKLAKGGA